MSTAEVMNALPQLKPAFDPDGKLVPIQDELFTDRGPVTLLPVRALFRGTAKAPDLSQGPTPKLEPLFLFIEATILSFCETEGRDVSDQDIERIFSMLKRRPDSNDGKLLSYVRAATRLYMTHHEVSQGEYEAVMARLARSARTFSAPPLSRNYLATLRDTIGQAYGFT
jgi:hypothetical protein